MADGLGGCDLQRGEFSIAMTRPLFSVITTTLNQGACLRGAIESVLSQDGLPFEHIVVDGGSSDNTESILADYPHLTVLKVPFVSPSQALNAGFAVARGEILSWLSPNDRYLPGAFEVVAREIERHPVVMGGCAVCDARGDTTTQIDNIERTWFDTMKYWVSHAVPTQPAVFFKRGLLAELEMEPGEVFDEGLHLAMDFDLWLRIQEYYPFSLRIPEVVARRVPAEPSVQPVDAGSVHREMSRIFRRHASRRVQPEQNFSFVLPVNGPLVEARSLFEQIDAQTVSSIEVVIVDYSGTPATSRLIRDGVFACGARYRNIAFQCVSLSGESEVSLAAAIDLGVRSARSHIVACLGGARSIPETFAADASRAFLRDEVGLLLPYIDPETSSRLFIEKHGTAVFNPAGPFSLPQGFQLDCVVRKLAWLDCGGFALHDRFPTIEFNMKRLMVMLAHKAWLLVHEPLLNLESGSVARNEGPFRLYENSVVVDEIAREMRRNPFSVMRVKSGYGLVLPDDLWQSAQGVIQRIPDAGPCAILELSRDELKDVAERNPAYGPALYYLAQVLRESGDRAEAERVLDRWREVHKGERSSPLYGGVLG